MQCKHYTKRTMEKRPFCRLNKEWNPNCKGCEQKAYKEYKKLQAKTELKAKAELKKVSKKHAKLEKNRESIITDDLTKCIECGKTKEDIHELYRGKNRRISIKYKLVIPLCRLCHDNPDIEKKWRTKGKQIFMKHYNKTEQDFADIFQIKQ